jgi:hypothetical protein
MKSKQVDWIHIWAGILAVIYVAALIFAFVYICWDFLVWIWNNFLKI